MKKILTAFTSCIVTACACAEFVPQKPLAVTVGATSTRIAAGIAKSVPTSWATNTAYVVGDYVVYSNRRYWATTAGTSGGTISTAPASTTGDWTNDAPVTWRYVPNRRNGIAIVNNFTGTLHLGVGYAAVAGQGIRLPADGTAVFETPAPVPLNEIYAITDGGTSTVQIQEY